MPKVHTTTPAATPRMRWWHMQLSTVRMLFLVWVYMGLIPMVLQIRSFVNFVTPHKVSARLVAPENEIKHTTEIWRFCPAKEWFGAGVYWNFHPTHYFKVEQGYLCHFVVPQYNIHGHYMIGTATTDRYKTSPGGCENASFPFQHYFYHGSFGFYALYGELKGTYCAYDGVAYVQVKGYGTFDSNGPPLAEDGGSTEYRRSYWYTIVGAIWITLRCFVLRRGFVFCMRFARLNDIMGETLSFRDANVFVHEALRLSAHGANNYQRIIIIYLLVEGLMSDLFLLTTREGLSAWLQFISLGYNLAGIMSVQLEISETSMKESTRHFIKRLLLNHETVFVGEFIIAIAMKFFVTSLNRSTIKQLEPAAEAVSHYLTSFVGHGIIVIVCSMIMVIARAVSSAIFVQLKFGTLAIFTAPCCVDTVLGIRNKLIALGGYSWEDGKLYYNTRTLRAFGALRVVEDDGREFLALNKLHWTSVPKHDLIVIGTVTNLSVTPSNERSSAGLASFFDYRLGGDIGDTGNYHNLDNSG
ncbi:unnamed protein product [Phytophthora lilii]|uniref:Unnamed protein product n=1 Tax=Phytophthora lilii TaxID=2077276 RepID=A0A9W6U803_9STRA|nr:unnamed protein product [Phytophthora lilii]